MSDDTVQERNAGGGRTSPYHMGYLGGHLRISPDLNPFSFTSPEHRWWLMGYEDASMDLRQTWPPTRPKPLGKDPPV